MNAQQLVKVFNSFPEVQILHDCVRRLGIRMGLRGGVLRNVVMSESGQSSHYDSLYNFVDPFGDIDIVVPKQADQNRLVRAVFAEVPFADCHVWDFQSERSAELAARKMESVAADRLILWIDDKVNLGAISGDVEKILNRPAQGERALLGQVDVGNPAVQLLQLVKHARIQLQSPEEFKSLELDLGESVDGLREPFRAWRPSRRLPLWQGVLSRLEIELAQLLLNAADWSQATSFVRHVARSAAGEWLGGSGALRTVFTPELEKSARVGAAVYRPRARAVQRVEVMTAGPDESRPGDPNWSRIPWTRLTLSNLNEGTCCPYSDFEEGIAVIAWRNSEAEATLRDHALQEQEYGAVARPSMPGQSKEEESAVEDLIPLSGHTRKGRSIAIRVDPAYLKLITGGRHSTFLVGLVPVTSSGSTGMAEQAVPEALSPQGESSKKPVQSDDAAKVKKENEAKSKRLRELREKVIA